MILKFQFNLKFNLNLIWEFSIDFHYFINRAMILLRVLLNYRYFF